jgi:hypothetical protein
MSICNSDITFYFINSIYNVYILHLLAHDHISYLHYTSLNLGIKNMTFTSLAKDFLSFFSYHYTMTLVWKSSHIFDKLLPPISQDHIHEWHRRRSLCKIETTLELLLYWFLKSLFPLIAKDVATTMPQTKEEAITKAQHFDLIYSQSRYLYIVLPDAP